MRWSGRQPSEVRRLRARRIDTLIFTGATDVCVLATILGAVDRGYRIIGVTDAICSSSDEGHDAFMRVYHSRYSEQIETTDAQTVLSLWLPEIA